MWIGLLLKMSQPDGVRAEGLRVQEPLGEIVEVVQAVERDEAIDAARHQPLNPESMDIERLKLEAERAAASRNAPARACGAAGAAPRGRP